MIRIPIRHTPWLVTLALLAAMPAGAAKKARFEYGLTLGYSISAATGNYVGQEGLSRNMNPGLTGGVQFTWNATQQFSLQPELLYRMKGYGYTGSADAPVESASLLLTYIELPVLGQYDLWPDRHTSAVLFAGPSVAVLVGDQLTVEFPTRRRDKTFDIENTNLFDAGVVLGVRFRFPAYNDTGFFELRYMTSFTSFLSDSDRPYLYIGPEAASIGAPGSASAHHHVFTAAFGLSLY
ncbi:MAG: hypothetical protein MAG453_01899 [Calditrichaeota bacterium]|nr:hypothetical protein [Calditrichota bacterium]